MRGFAPPWEPKIWPCLCFRDLWCAQALWGHTGCVCFGEPPTPPLRSATLSRSRGGRLRLERWASRAAKPTQWRTGASGRNQVSLMWTCPRLPWTRTEAWMMSAFLTTATGGASAGIAQPVAWTCKSVAGSITGPATMGSTRGFVARKRRPAAHRRQGQHKTPATGTTSSCSPSPTRTTKPPRHTDLAHSLEGSGSTTSLRSLHCKSPHGQGANGTVGWAAAQKAPSPTNVSGGNR